MNKKILTTSMALLTSLSLLTVQRANAQTHTVQNGEYLEKIAANYGVSIDSLRAWNGLSSDMIFVGDVLVVDGDTTQSTTTSTTTTNTAQTTASGIHVVSAGEALYTIAQRYGITVDQLVAWNGLSSDWLNVGDTLVVYGDPSATATYTPSTIASSTGYHTVVAGDTLSGIAAAYGVTVADLWAWNGLSSDWLWGGEQLAVGGYAPVTSTVVATTPSTVTNNTTGTYTVASGDSLYTIALAHGVTVDQLMATNGLTSTFLQVGDQLVIPGYETTETSDATTNDNATDDADTTTVEISDEEKAQGIKAKHKVVAGDNLWRIANKYSVTVHQLREWNQLAEDATIKVDDVLVIKGSTYEPKKHKVTAEDTLETIATTYHTTVEHLKEWNKLTETAPTVDTELIVSDPEPTLHEVKQGENLQSIADMYAVSLEDLRTWNELPKNSMVVNGTIIVSDPAGK